MESDREKRGGMPVLCGTRISVHELTDLTEQETLEGIFATFLSPTAERVENAKAYAAAHPMSGMPKRV